MKKFLVLLLAVAAVVCGSAKGVLLASATASEFVPGHSPGKWDREDLQSSEKCPRTIRHLGYRVTGNEDVFVIRHGNIEQDNIECGGGGQMVFISAAALLDPDRLVKATPTRIRLAINRYLVDDSMYMASALRLNGTNTKFYAVVETSRRFCGPTTRFEAGTQGFFFATGKKPAEGDITSTPLPLLPQFSVSPLPESSLIMALFEAGRGGRKCLYNAPLRDPKAPLNQRPATPKPTPSTSMEASPPPSPQPSQSESPSPTPSKSMEPPFADGSGIFGSESNAGAPSKKRVCFPADATVTVRNGQDVRMDELKIGDEVHIGRGRYSRVFMFTHRDASAVAPQYVRVRTACGRALVATLGHHVYIEGALAPIETARIGSSLVLADGASASVVAVDTVQRRGLFNPQTLQGDIVVDGILASTYTTAVNPRLAHPLLLPVRAVATLCSLKAAT